MRPLAAVARWKLLLPWPVAAAAVQAPLGLQAFDVLWGPTSAGAADVGRQQRSRATAYQGHVFRKSALLRSEEQAASTSSLVRLAPVSFLERNASEHHADPNQDCEMGEWGPWAECTKSCGSGQRFRSRTVLREQRGSGKPCDAGQKMTGKCNIMGCPSDCDWDAWGHWQGCSVTCGGGFRLRYRDVLRNAANGGHTCASELSVSNETCEPEPCSIDCEWSEWSPWSDCSKECGGGRAYRTRTKNGPFNGGFECTGDAEDAQDCGTHICNTDCLWGEWSLFSECTKACGVGMKERFRDKMQEQSGSGAHCVGNVTDIEYCNLHACPQDCVWEDWEDWSAKCTVTCGHGAESRHRQFKQAAEGGGEKCKGNPFDYRSCNAFPCPIDCTWMDWSSWGACSVTSEWGVNLRNRDKIVEMHGGVPCEGAMEETQPCCEHHCDLPGGAGQPVQLEPPRSTTPLVSQTVGEQPHVEIMPRMFGEQPSVASVPMHAEVVDRGASPTAPLHGSEPPPFVEEARTPQRFFPHESTEQALSSQHQVAVGNTVEAWASQPQFAHGNTEEAQTSQRLLSTDAWVAQHQFTHGNTEEARTSRDYFARDAMISSTSAAPPWTALPPAAASAATGGGNAAFTHGVWASPEGATAGAAYVTGDPSDATGIVGNHATQSWANGIDTRNLESASADWSSAASPTTTSTTTSTTTTTTRESIFADIFGFR